MGPNVHAASKLSTNTSEVQGSITAELPPGTGTGDIFRGWGSDGIKKPFSKKIY